MGVSDYDTNPTNNSTISGIDISEGCSPAGINNAIRQMMADLASFDQAGLSGFGLTATAAEINVLDGVTATTAEINILDGVTATTAEINALDGVTAKGTELVRVADQAAGRAALGLGTASTATTGTATGNVPVLVDVGGSPGLPAVDGSNLTGVSVAPNYTSLITGWTANTTTTLVHGLGATPSRVEVVLVAKGTSGGHAIGDELEVSPSYQSGSRGMHWARNGTDIYVMHTSSIFPILRDGSGFMSAATSTDWDIRVRAWL